MQESEGRKRRNFAVPWRLEAGIHDNIPMQMAARVATVRRPAQRFASGPTRETPCSQCPAYYLRALALPIIIQSQPMSSSNQSSDSPMLPIQFYIRICNSLSTCAHSVPNMRDTRRLIRRQQSEIPNSSLTPEAPPACESSCFCAAHYCFAVAHNFPRGAPANQPASERARVRIVCCAKLWLFSASARNY